MFRGFVYLDEKKLNSYISILEQKAMSHTQSVSSKKTKKMGLAAKNAFNAEFSDEKTYTEELVEDPSFIYDKFEQMLCKQEGEEFFDFLTNGDLYDLSSLPPMSLFRTRGYIEIPESFDMLNLLEQFKPILIDSFDEDENFDIISSVISDTKQDIPIIIDSGDISISGKINKACLKEEYTSLEDYEDQEVIVLCKVIALNSNENVTIFNPAKDFIKLNRAMRRAANFDSNETFAPIMIEGPVLKVEIIAIYK